MGGSTCAPKTAVNVARPCAGITTRGRSEKARAGSCVQRGDASVFGAVSLADKLDTLAGYFGLGLVPTGSSDPYGLRRAAQGAVRVLLDFWQSGETEKRPSLRKLAEAAAAGYEGRLKRPAPDVVRDLEAFLLDRLRYVFTARGFAGDEVEAVLGAREPDALDDPLEAWKRLQALHRVRLEATEDFEALAVAFKRAKNILGDQAPSDVDTKLLQESAERDLHAAVAKLQPPRWWPRGGGDGGYESRLRSLSGLRGPWDRFFDDVHVMAEDPRLRAPSRPALAGPLAVLSHRGHLETWRLRLWLNTSISSAAARRTATRT